MRRCSLTLAALCLALASLPGQASAHENDVLPDLDQIAPTDIRVASKVVKGFRIFRLGFASAAANVGAGDLTLHGYRPSRRVKTMRVDQLIDQTQGVARLVRDVGRMSYVVHPDHRHWHLLGFERYELRRPGSTGATVYQDRKTGFCLGDRYAIPDADKLAGFNPTPLQGDTCGLGRSDLLGLFAGISTGWADRYEAHIEGQYIDITDLPSGRWVLVHRVNVEGRIQESNYANNASSALLSIQYLNGRRRRPRVQVLQTCYASAQCGEGTVGS